ncbi:MAG: hypothetical protein KJO98_06475 [Rhodothermia bacterium]|nr:hypothetical protein [Rhodothermia bacterium]
MFARFAVLMIAAGLAACAAPSAPKPINPAYELVVSDAEYRKRLEDWFNCDECVNGQLRRVQELGDFAVDDLIRARGGILIQISGVDITLADNIALLTTRCTKFTTGLPGSLTTAVTTAECMGRFEAQRDQRFRGRATEALLAIRTPKACANLGVNRCTNLAAFFPPVGVVESGRSVREIIP